MTAQREPLRDPREQECVCPQCGEGLFYVEGIRGPERWKHTRTGDWRCAPVCRDCGQPGTERIGHETVGGDGFLTFISKFWLCVTCARRRLFIERT